MVRQVDLKDLFATHNPLIRGDAAEKGIEKRGLDDPLLLAP
jgi:hypothetical protein